MTPDRPAALRYGRPVLLLITGMISIQSGASFAKHLFPLMGPIGTTALRVTFAALLLMLIWRPWKEKWDFSKLRQLFYYGVALGLMNITFYLAVARIPLGIAVALEFTGPLAIAIFLSRRPIDLLWAALATIGVGTLLLPRTETPVLDLIGVAYALAAAVCWGAYILLGQRAGDSMHGGHAAAWGMFFAAITVLPFAIFSEDHRFLNPSIWPIALAVAIFSSALPYTLEMLALKELPPVTFGLLMSMEPAIAALAGMVILHEHLSTLQWLAIAAIIVASTGSSFLSPARPEPAGYSS